MYDAVAHFLIARSDPMAARLTRDQFELWWRGLSVEERRPFSPARYSNGNHCLRWIIQDQGTGQSLRKEMRVRTRLEVGRNGIVTAKFKIIGPDGREVSHLKRHPKANGGGVSVWLDGDTFHPSRRDGYVATPFKLQGAKLYHESAAKSWLKSLAKAGRDGFKMVEA